MTSINPIDYLLTTEIDAAYDINKDGTVTIEDYYLACKRFADDDPDNDPVIAQGKWDETFAALKEQERKDYPQNYQEINKNSANTEAEKIIAAINSAETSPSSAKTLNQLQLIASNLTKYIKQCAELAQVMQNQIPGLENEVKELENEKNTKEREYEKIEQQIENESKALDKQLCSVLDNANKNNANYQKKTEETVAKCIKAYAEGQYPNERLYNVISRELALSAGLNTSDLKRELNNCTAKGEEIKSLCNNIYNLVVDLREIESKYKDKNTYLNRTINNRAALLSSAETANTKYQTGYAVRETLRKDLIETYKSDNQIQSLNNFLNNKELDNMPYADAIAVMFGFTDANNEKITGAFTNCGVKYNAKTNVISIPISANQTLAAIYNGLAKSLKENYGVDPDWIDAYSTDTTTAPTVNRYDPNPPKPVEEEKKDPIGFTIGNIKYDFIQDNNKDGIFNDASEFLGVKNGWKDMFKYDQNGDGELTDDELKSLKILAKNTTNGQFSFTNAAAVGVTSIDLNSYKEINKKEQNLNVTAGTFEVNMNGTIIEGKNSFDTSKNLNNEFATVFGSEIKNLNSTYEENPFLEDFVETTNSKQVKTKTQNDIAETNNTIKQNQKRTKTKVEEKTSESITKAKIAKRKASEKDNNISESESETANETTNTVVKKIQK